jgi:hypothetical protein
MRQARQSLSLGSIQLRSNAMLNYRKYKQLVDTFEALMIENQKISEVKLGPEKWSLKEIVGHLIDSASNNHQRFARLQIEQTISLPGYDAEAWVSISNIQNLDFDFMVGFWKMYNYFLLNLIHGIEPKNMKNIWKTIDGKEYTLEFLIDDYFAHMELHLQMFIDRKQEIEKSTMT